MLFMKYYLLLLSFGLSFGSYVCHAANPIEDKNSAERIAGIQQLEWGTVDGQKIYLFTLTNSNGMRVKISNFGGIITSIVVPDVNNNFSDVVLGFDNLQQYIDGHPCFGATIGRYANRIANASFRIDGREYDLTANSGRHCIHGGAEGFDKKVWQAEAFFSENGLAVRLHYLSPDGEEGFPGNLDTTVNYTLTENNAVNCRFQATTDKPTHVSLTQHSYFNLNGCKTTIDDHLIRIKANTYTEIDGDIVPTGKISTVKGKEWDLTTLTRMGDHFDKLNYNGYHFNYIFDKPLGQLEQVIDVIDPLSGRMLEVSSTQPGVQFYSGNSIDDKYIGKNDIRYGPHMGFCLETQHFPDSPNHPNFPSTLLRPSQRYDHTVIYKFGTVKNTKYPKEMASSRSSRSNGSIADRKRPNIVLLFADDLGWGDVGFQRNKFESPHIDQFAKESMVFSDAYAASPTCSPSRAAILTGRHPARLRIVRHIPGGDKFGRHTEAFHVLQQDPAQFKSRNWLPLEEKTFAERLKQLGYRACFVGKWHLGHEPYHPVHQGFDEQYGVCNFGQPGSYFAPYWPGRSETYKDVPKGKYLTDQLTDDAVTFLQKQKGDHPFLLALFYYNAHSPWQAKEELITRFEAKGLRDREAKKAAMIVSLDESVGRILNTLKEMGFSDNTVVMFASDQGSRIAQTPMRGGKPAGQALYEGGARVPFIINWPGVTEPGSRCEIPVSTIDVCPTMLEIAANEAAKYPDLDGKSLVPLLRKQSDLDREAIYLYRCYDGQYAAVRQGNWKIIAYHDGHCELYNLKDDIGEQNDLAEKMPDKVTQMKSKLLAWEKEMGLLY